MPKFDRTTCQRTDSSRWDPVHACWREIVFAEQKSWPTHPKINVVDLFCSTGGLTLGVIEAAAALNVRAKVQLAVDIDEKALEVYNKNLHPASMFNGSVDRLVAYSLESDLSFHHTPSALPPLVHLSERVDLVIGGPPCQGHSGLNNKSRRKDPRNSLYLSAVAAAIAVGAKCLILENVPEIKRSHLEVVEGAKRLLANMGYESDDFVLSAHELGWPQTRRRHFLVASQSGLVPLNEVAQEFYERAPGAATFLGSLPKRSSFLETLPEYSDVTAERLRFYQRNPELYDLPLSERPDCHKQGTTYKSVYGRMRPEEPVPTLTTGFLTMGRGRFIHPTELRTLTPGEAAFVQGFPAWFNFESPSVTRNDLSKWIGDAVPVPLGYVAAMTALRPYLAGVRVR